MPMQMWLTRPREFEQLDQAINDACCREDVEMLQAWADALDQVVTAGAATGIGSATGAFPGPGQAHFYQHWVGDDATGPLPQPPTYWPYAWGKSPHPAAGRLRIDRLVSFGLQWSILKVIAAHQINPDDASNRPACSTCRTHVTVWVCYEVSESEKLLAAADLDFRKSLFRVGVIESRDAVVLVINTPRPIELTGGVTRPPLATEQFFKEPVIVTQGFTDGETPKWKQPVTIAPTVGAPGTVGQVGQKPLPPGDRYMPEGKYPEDPPPEVSLFVRLPTKFREFNEATPSDLIKAILRQAAEQEDLDLSPEIINRLRITVEDE
jgi:hypothetical protein